MTQRVDRHPAAILSADPRQRDSTWAMVSNVFGPLAAPAALDAVSPAPGQQFGPEEFVRSALRREWCVKAGARGTPRRFTLSAVIHESDTRE